MKIFLAGLAVSWGALAASAADPVAEFGRNYPAFPRGQFTATERATGDPKMPPDTVRVYRVWMDPPQWKVHARTSRTSTKDGKPSTYTNQSELLYPGTGQIIVNTEPATGRLASTVSAHIKTLPPDLARGAGRGTFRFAIDGANMRNDQKTYVELLAESKPRNEPGTLNGRGVVVVHAENDWGKLTLWLDPARGHLPLKVVQEKTGDHQAMGGKRIKTFEKNEDGKPTPLRKWTEEFETTRIETVAGRGMVTAFTHRGTTVWGDGSVDEEVTTVALTEIKPVAGWDKNPFVMSTAIPNGTPVTAQDDRPIEYEWRDGAIVKAVRQSVVDGADATAFVAPARRTRWWLFPTIAAAAAVLGILIWRISARRGA